VSILGRTLRERARHDEEEVEQGDHDVQEERKEEEEKDEDVEVVREEGAQRMMKPTPSLKAVAVKTVISMKPPVW